MTTIFTVGHSNKSLAAFIELLAGVGMETLIDVRSRPYSRYCPWFNKNSLAAELPANGIYYVWMGDQLGGMGKNRDFNGGIERALEMAQLSMTAVMCSEAKPSSCHRQSVLTPEFQLRAAEVFNIMWGGAVEPATLFHVKQRHDTPKQEGLFAL